MKHLKLPQDSQQKPIYWPNVFVHAIIFLYQTVSEKKQKTKQTENCHLSCLTTNYISVRSIFSKSS